MPVVESRLNGPPCGASSFSEFVDSGASFFSAQYEPSLLVDDSCEGDVTQKPRTGGNCSEVSSFRRNQLLSPPLAGWTLPFSPSSTPASFFDFRLHPHSPAAFCQASPFVGTSARSPSFVGSSAPTRRFPPRHPPNSTWHKRSPGLSVRPGLLLMELRSHRGYGTSFAPFFSRLTPSAAVNKLTP